MIREYLGELFEDIKKTPLAKFLANVGKNDPNYELNHAPYGPWQTFYVICTNCGFSQHKEVNGPFDCKSCGFDEYRYPNNKSLEFNSIIYAARVGDAEYDQAEGLRDLWGRTKNA